MQETWVRCLGPEDPLEKEMATHSSTFAFATKFNLEWLTPYLFSFGFFCLCISDTNSRGMLLKTIFFMPLVHEILLQWYCIFDDLWSVFFYNFKITTILFLLNIIEIYFGFFFLPTMSNLTTNCCHFSASSIIFISISIK